MVCAGSGHLFFDPKQKMGRLPTELVDMIVLKMDVRTLGVLYDRGTLKDMVSAPAAQEIEEKVLQRAREEHERLLSFVHNDMIYIYNYIHTWFRTSFCRQQRRWDGCRPPETAMGTAH